MVGEELGFAPMSGWSILWTTLWILIVIMVPGFLLSLALFPRREELETSERIALSFFLGLAPIFILTTLNILLEVRITFMSDLLAFLFVSGFGILVFLYRGGNLNLVEWWGAKGSQAYS
jgi:uncharacterized membrane protein